MSDVSGTLAGTGVRPDRRASWAGLLREWAVMSTDLSWFRIPTDTSPGSLNAVFQLLDRRVVAGGADDPVLVGDRAPVSTARLLEDVAAVGGVLVALGVGPGTPVAWRGRTDREGVTALLALARVGGRLDDAGSLAILEDGVGETDWAAVLKLGRTDPAPAAELAPEHPWNGGVQVRHLAQALAGVPTPLTPPDLAGVLLGTTLAG